MACPYCGSGDWEEDGILDTVPDGQYIIVEFDCQCLTCDRYFVTREWYQATDSYEPRALTIEEEREWGQKHAWPGIDFGKYEEGL